MGLATLCYAGIGLAMLRYCVATRALSLLLAAGAIPKFESVTDTTFYLYGRTQTRLHDHINKKKPCYCKAFELWVEDGIRTHDKKSSYSTHYQQVATATFKHLQIGLQIRAQLFVV